MIQVSVIIPTLNEEGYIEKTLSALKPQLKKGDEIIVVDSYSKDNTIKIAKSFGAKVVFIPRCGIGPAKTFGAKKAKNEVIAMLDADGAPNPDWLDRIKEHFKNPKTQAIAGFDVYVGPTKARTLIYTAFSWVVWYIAKANYRINKIPWVPVNNCAIRKDIFFKYDGLHNVVCEDLDFAKRAKGMPLIYDKHIRVTLSDRRYKKEGFLKTVWLWIKSDIAIVRNKKTIAATDYAVTR